jgi:hypothetical protein
MGQGGNGGMFKCQKCPETFDSQQELDTHMEQQHSAQAPAMGDALGE